MPSPFPGMDPFVESQEWREFHFRAINAIADLLGPRLGEKYVARCQMRVYVEHDPDWTEFGGGSRHIEPDIAFVREAGRQPSLALIDELMATIVCDQPEPEEHREAYLVLKNPETHDVVTVVELLSPTNKRPGSTGREEYLRKRDEVLRSGTHLVEIDLLRGGHRMPMRPRSPVTGECVAMVSRANRRPQAELIAWPLAHRLPVLPVPLAEGDTDTSFDLQIVLDTVYDRARYDRTLNYAAPLIPPADADTQRWIDELGAAPHTPKAPAE